MRGGRAWAMVLFCRQYKLELKTLLFNHKHWGLWLLFLFSKCNFQLTKVFFAQRILSCWGFPSTQFSQPCCPLHLLQAAPCGGREGQTTEKRDFCFLLHKLQHAIEDDNYRERITNLHTTFWKRNEVSVDPVKRKIKIEEICSTCFIGEEKRELTFEKPT